MKNIAIFGSSRSGKSTLAKMLAKHLGNYHIIIGDDIRWAFKEVLPNNQINSKGGAGMAEDFPNFLAVLFYKSIKRNAGEINYIIETCDITPQKAKALFCHDNTITLFLGTPSQTPEQHYAEIKKYQTEKDWTFTRSDQDIMRHSIEWVKNSKIFEEECKKLNIWFVDTSFNREKVLDETFNKILSMVES